jgi:hypothetical protein
MKGVTHNLSRRVKANRIPVLGAHTGNENDLGRAGWGRSGLSCDAFVGLQECALELLKGTGDQRPL